MVRLVCIGDNTIDTYLDQALQFPGGNAVNVAAFGARLGASSAYVGCIGNDMLGQLILQSLTSEGVDVSHCQIRNGANAWACVTHETGDRVFLGSDSGVCKQLAIGERELHYLNGFDLIHSSIYSGIENQLAALHQLGPTVSFDFSDDWTAAQLEALAPQVEIAFLSAATLNETECQQLFERVHQLGPKVVVLTRGQHGALASAHGQVFAQQITPVKVVDTLGAGDGFIAAFLVNWQQKKPLNHIMKSAADYAALVCTSAGGFGHGQPAAPDTLRKIRHALSLA